MFCTKCGKEIKDDSLFCIGCGAPVPPEKRAESAASAEGGSAAAAAKKPVNKTLIILAVMIAVFFLIIFAFFSIMRGMKKENEEPSVPDKQQEVAAEVPFKGFGSLSIGDRVVFGKYEQDGKKDNGAEPLEWDVIGQKDGKYMLITHYVIDYMQFDNGMADTGVNAGGNATDSIVTWEKCSLRQWLNGDFYSDTFTNEERAYIATVSNYNPNWLEFDDDHLGASGITTGGFGGNVTNDKVFLLSVPDLFTYLGPMVVRSGYNRDFFPSAVASATPYAQSLTESGLCLSMDEAFGNFDKRNTSGSAWRTYYEGYVDVDYMEKEAFLCWFTRSPGCYKDSSAEFTVQANGGPQPGYLKSWYGGVRPVVWVTP